MKNPRHRPVAPLFEHGCRGCVGLGSYGTEGKTYDLYFCQQTGEPTVIARYGNKGPDYISGWFSGMRNLQRALEGHSVKATRPLATALLRVLELIGTGELRVSIKLI